MPGFLDSLVVEEGGDEAAVGSTCYTGAIEAARLFENSNRAIWSRRRRSGERTMNESQTLIPNDAESWQGLTEKGT